MHYQNLLQLWDWKYLLICTTTSMINFIELSLKNWWMSMSGFIFTVTPSRRSRIIRRKCGDSIASPWCTSTMKDPPSFLPWSSWTTSTGLSGGWWSGAASAAIRAFTPETASVSTNRFQFEIGKVKIWCS